MIALIQRVQYAHVSVNNQIVGQIQRGLLALIGVVRDDSPLNAEKLAQKLASYRVFPDENGKMNLNIGQIGGEILLVSQFTLAADTQKGTRPSFTPAAPPELAEKLFENLIDLVKNHNIPVQTGIFGADMQITLCNDGPVTFWLES